MIIKSLNKALNPSRDKSLKISSDKALKPKANKVSFASYIKGEDK